MLDLRSVLGTISAMVKGPFSTNREDWVPVGVIVHSYADRIQMNVYYEFEGEGPLMYTEFKKFCDMFLEDNNSDAWKMDGNEITVFCSGWEDASRAERGLKLDYQKDGCMQIPVILA